MGYIDLAILFSVLGIGYFAVKEKAFWNMRRSMEPVPSPFSKALIQLVGIAGGIYLALAFLMSFLSVELPERVKALGFSIDPLALLSMLLAVVQPYLIRLRYFIKKRKI